MYRLRSDAGAQLDQQRQQPRLFRLRSDAVAQLDRQRRRHAQLHRLRSSWTDNGDGTHSCTVCGATEAHSWENGVCSKCGYVCAHPQYIQHELAHECAVCGFVEAHNKVFAHTQQVCQECTVCGAWWGHHVETIGGKCTVCGDSNVSIG